ncbi:energy transducer TonB [Christiangramia echinicola]|uniref:energy transducer TonB n=1 Tax=Christiangramia echinicola TaxID=279359 RepID=UPI000415A130|nr:energy transducer TonB [Christiangramia echinicola]
MISKKNPKADLNKYKMIFFQIGLIITLGISYIGIEWSFDNRTELDDQKVQVKMTLTEDIPITEMKTPVAPPHPPPPVPEIIEVVEDHLEIEETEIQSTESSLDDRMEYIVEVSQVVEGNLEEEIEDIPFVLIANVPIYPGCENEVGNEAKKHCMSQKVQDHVAKEFNNGLGATLGLKGIHRIMVVFKIDSSGEVTNIRARAPHKDLEAEAIRVINLLPKMTPGHQRNRPVGVIYSLPIVFEVRPPA